MCVCARVLLSTIGKRGAWLLRLHTDMDAALLESCVHESVDFSAHIFQARSVSWKNYRTREGSAFRIPPPPLGRVIVLCACSEPPWRIYHGTLRPRPPTRSLITGKVELAPSRSVAPPPNRPRATSHPKGRLNCSTGNQFEVIGTYSSSGCVTIRL